MEPDDLLCSRNARPPKALVGRAQWKIKQPPSLVRERASLKKASISLDARRCGLTEAILKSKILTYSLPENGWLSEERISGKRGRRQCPFSWFKLRRS